MPVIIFFLNTIPSVFKQLKVIECGVHSNTFLWLITTKIPENHARCRQLHLKSDLTNRMFSAVSYTKPERPTDVLDI